MLRNIGSNWVLIVVTIGATYLITPFVIHSLGKDGYGTWTLITSMTGYMSILALGVPAACVRYLTQYVTQNDSARMNQAIGSCAGLYLVVGAAAALIGVVLTMIFALYDIPSAFEAEATLAFAIMVLTVAGGFIGLLPEGIMFAHHDFVVRNLVRVSGVLLRLGLTVGLLMLHATLVVLATIQLACLAFDFGVSWLLITRRYPDVRISLGDFDRGMVRQIFSFSLYVLLLNAGARLSFETDAIVIGALMGVGSIPFFAVANSLVIYLMEFMVAIAAVVCPMTTKLNTDGNLVELKEMFLKWSKIALSLTMMAGLFLVVLGPRFLGWWIDPSFEQPAGEVLQILVISSLVFLPVRAVALPVLIGLGKPRTPAIALAVAGVANLGLSIALIGPFGLAGVAMGTAIPNILFAVFVLAIACRELEISLPTYVKYVAPRATVGALPILALLLWFRLGLRVESIVGLITAGSVMVVVFGITWVFFVFRNDPYVSLRIPLVRRRLWSRA